MFYRTLEALCQSCQNVASRIFVASCTGRIHLESMHELRYSPPLFFGI